MPTLTWADGKFYSITASVTHPQILAPHGPVGVQGVGGLDVERL